MEQNEYKHFNELFKVDVSDYIEKRKSSQGTELNYLSWANAWAEVKKRFPDANYKILTFNDLPYVVDENIGYMVFTEVTIENITHQMWLPVLDMNFKPMKSKTYTYTTKYGEKEVQPATMFDINKTLMRCLAKNLAMFGLGLYIYAGEDLPEGEVTKDVKQEKPKQKQSLSKESLELMQQYNIKEERLKEFFKTDCLTDELVAKAIRMKGNTK